jgi:hypothetical protein
MIAGGVGVMLGRALRLPTAAAYVAIGALRAADPQRDEAAMLGAGVTLEELADPGETVVHRCFAHCGRPRPGIG